MDINVIINNIKTKILDLVEGFIYTEEEINKLVLAYLAILMFDPEIEDLLDQVLRENYICFSEDLLSDLLNFSNEEYNKDEIWDYSCITGISMDPDLLGDKWVNVPFLIVEKQKSLFVEMDILIHELKHKINIIVSDYSSVPFKNGLSEQYEAYTKFILIDEAFNSFLVKLYLDNLLYLKQFPIKDQSIKNLLARIKAPKRYRYPEGYKKYIIGLLPLFENKEFFWKLYNQALFKKDLAGLRELCLKITHSEISYDVLVDNLDNFDLNDLKEMFDLIANSQNYEPVSWPEDKLSLIRK